jgi:drug/metabolite transporter (DMT)-like permease
MTAVTTIGVVAALGSAASWALGAVLFKKLGDQLSSPGMALAKSFFSAGLLGAVLLAVGGFEKMSWEALLWLGLSGVLGIALGDTLFFAALKKLSPTTLIMFLTSGQILTVLLAVLFLGETPTPRAWLGIILVIVGITVSLWSNVSGEKQASQRKGLVLGAFSVLCMSFSMVIAKKGLAEVSAMQALFVRMSAAGTGLLLLSTFESQSAGWLAPFKNTGLLGQFFASVCVITFGGFWLSLLAIKHLDVSVANTLNSVEPLFVLPLAACFLKEKVRPAAWAGAVVAVFGIACLCL